jgi:hypothetical protein
MECDFNLLCYGLFLIPKTIIIFKSLLSILKRFFKKKSFVIFYICLITSWFEIGNGKKCYFQYHLNIHSLSQFLITLEKDFKKEL